MIATVTVETHCMSSRIKTASFVIPVCGILGGVADDACLRGPMGWTVSRNATRSAGWRKRRWRYKVHAGDVSAAVVPV